MGNIQTQKSFELRSKLVSTSILKTLTFSSRQSLNLYIHQLRSRMTLRSYSFPRIVYFNQIPSPKVLSCQNIPSYKLEVYFQDYGQAYSYQQVMLDQCRCMELLEAIGQLKDRYGCFEVSLSSIFVKREENYRKVIVWINNQVQQCNPANKCDQISMCQSIVNTLQFLMKGKCFQNYQNLSNNKHNFISFFKLKQAIQKSHIQPITSIKQQVKSAEDVFTFKHILNQTNQYTAMLPKISQAAIIPNNSASLQHLQQKQQKIQQKPSAQMKTSNQPGQMKIQMTKKQKIPPLNMKSLCQYLSDQNSQSQRVILSQNQSIQQIKQLYNEQKQYEDIITTARSPERNYIMRKSDQLTIFPNQYLIKFQNKHKINCEAQVKQSYLAFKKAMSTLKARQNPQSDRKPHQSPHPTQQKPILSYR